MPEFQDAERLRMAHLISDRAAVFYGATSGGIYRKQPRDFFLTAPLKNLFIDIQNSVPEYFRRNNISFWGGSSITGHTLSSQVACLNHLFLLREDAEAAALILQKISPEFVRPLTINSDAYAPAYIQFEAVSNVQHLNEGPLTRGAQCTSIDALMLAEKKNGATVLVPIEWKYTEHYGNENKAQEGCRLDPANCKGAVRRSRYNNLIAQSGQLKADKTDWCYYEPFYQLMRQTLWAERVLAHKDAEVAKADDFLHVHVIPAENTDLLNKIYPCSGLQMAATWREVLKDQAKYKIISPSELIGAVSGLSKYGALIEYLSQRYW